MLRLIFVIIFMQLFLSAQEQVSDIDFRGVNSNSDLSKGVGFLQINEVNYMLEEKESLIISKWDGNGFVLEHEVGNIDCQRINKDHMDPNRSLFEIREHKYYRILENGIQIIDVYSGSVTYEYNFENDGIDFITPIELHERRFYFTGNKDEINYRYQLDISSNVVTQIENKNRNELTQINDLLIGVEDKNLYISDLDTGEEVLLAVLQNNLVQVGIDRSNERFYLLESDGTLWLVDQEMNLVNTNCPIDNMDELRQIHVNGNNLVIIYEHTIGTPNTSTSKDRIVTYDLSSCNQTMDYTTGVRIFYAQGIQFVTSENDDTDYTFVGFYGSNPLNDGLEFGLYYVIDHKNKRIGGFDFISGIEDHTPFVHNDDLYFIAYRQSANFGRGQFIAKYEFENLSYKELNWHNDKARSATLGFPQDNNIIAALNSVLEEPQVLQINSEDKFQVIQDLDFNINLGLNTVLGVIPNQDEIFFASTGGLYSVLENSREIYNLENVTPIQTFQPGGNSTADYGLNYTDDKIAMAIETKRQYGGASLTYKIYDINTGETKIIELGDMNLSRRQLGPYMFHSGGDSQDTLQILDIRTGEIIPFPEMPFLILETAEGDGKGIFIWRASDASGDHKVFEIDYESSEITTIDIGLNAKRSIRVYAGHNNSYYFYDTGPYINDDNYRIQYLDAEGNISTIFDDAANLIDIIKSPYSDMTYFYLRDLDYNAIILAHDQINTDTIHLTDIDELYAATPEGILIKSNNKDFTPRVDERLYHFRPFEGVEELDFNIEARVYYEHVSDSVITLVTNADFRYPTYYTEYNFVDGVETTFEITVDGQPTFQACDFFFMSNLKRINEAEYICSVRCGKGFEPWILNRETHDLRPLKDLNPGLADSHPYNFTIFKDWVYFTALTKGGNRQVFRFPRSGISKNVELVSSHNHLEIYPIPAINQIHVKTDLKELMIFSMDGTLVHKQHDYTKDTPIQITSLGTGAHIIIGQDKEGEIYKSKFIKTEQ